MIKNVNDVFNKFNPPYDLFQIVLIYFQEPLRDFSRKKKKEEICYSCPKKKLYVYSLHLFIPLGFFFVLLFWYGPCSTFPIWKIVFNFSKMSDRSHKILTLKFIFFSAFDTNPKGSTVKMSRKTKIQLKKIR